MKIALNVNYVLTFEDENDFYNANGSLRESIRKGLIDLFPEKITVSENVWGMLNNGRECIPIIENTNCVRCDCCGKYLSISEELYLGLDYPNRVNGSILCNSCEWDMREPV